ncbi:MAG: hypothetical protein LRY27_00500 [Chitinophagales bacterium]|nr:hypothetical protein [Chitinophagales bacterium]
MLIKKKNRTKAKEYETFHSLDEKYIEYLNLCLNNAELDVYLYSEESVKGISKKELIIYEMLISLFERAFLMYSDQSDEIKRNQFEGWVGFMKDFAQKDKFLKAWNVIGNQWDENFTNFMNNLIKNM